MSDEEKTFNVSLHREKGFIFEVDFGMENIHKLIMDEPEPVGENKGPNASKVLAATMGNCLTASLLFCLQKARAEVGVIDTKVDGVLRRNNEGRWRIDEINVIISPDIDQRFNSHFERCSEIFEDFCVVSQSIEQGIPINVRIDNKSN
jgi:uncharacterized OsmC-like protein